MTTNNTVLPQVVRARDIAEAAQVHEVEVTKWCREGRFPRAFKLGDGRTSPWRIPLEDAIAFLRGEVPAPREPSADQNVDDVHQELAKT